MTNGSVLGRRVFENRVKALPSNLLDFSAVTHEENASGQVA